MSSSPPISPTSLSPGQQMASLTSILSMPTAPSSLTTTNIAAAVSAGASITAASSPVPPQLSSPTSTTLSAPPHGGIGGGGRGSASSNLAAPAPVFVQDLPFYHQLEEVQRIREGKSTLGGGRVASASPTLTGAGGAGGKGGAAAAAALAAGAETPSSPTEDGSMLAVFERQLEEVDGAKDALRKAGLFYGGGSGKGGNGSGGGGTGGGAPPVGGWAAAQAMMQHAAGEGQAGRRVSGSGDSGLEKMKSQQAVN